MREEVILEEGEGGGGGVTPFVDQNSYVSASMTYFMSYFVTKYDIKYVKT
jgi:hypothetical protein